MNKEEIINEINKEQNYSGFQPKELITLEKAISLTEKAKDEEFNKKIEELENLKCYCELCAFEGSHQNEEDKLVKLAEVKRIFNQSPQGEKVVEVLEDEK